jgi:Tol biopolymer transport system component
MQGGARFRVGLAVVLGGFGAFRAATADVALLSRSSLPSDTAMGESLTAVAPGPVGSIVSGDGRYVAFLSRALNVVAGQVDFPYTLDAFLFDRVTGSSVLVSHRAGSPATAVGAGGALAISRDGAYVAFTSFSPLLVAGPGDDNGGDDVFLYERATGLVTLASHAASSPTVAGNKASGSGGLLALSNDGRYAAFASAATDLAAGQVDTNAGPDVFRFDRSTGTVVLVSHRAGFPATAADGPSDHPSLSGDGRYVAFASSGTDLVAGQVDANGAADVFRFDGATGSLLLVSHASGSAATAGAGESRLPAVSGDGASVAYLSRAGDLVAGHADPGGIAWDAFLFDAATGGTILASRSAASATTSGNASAEPDEPPVLSDDGRYTVFASAATDLVPGQVDSLTTGGDDADLFLFDRTAGTTTLISHDGRDAPSATAGNLGSRSARISADGAAVAFTSGAALGYSENGAPDPDVFLFRRAAGTVALVSRAFDFVGAALGPASLPAISADGRYVAFTGSAPDHLLTDTNGAADVFLFESDGGAFGSNLFVSRHAAGLPSLSGNGPSFTFFYSGPALSADGRHAVFSTVSTDVFPFYGTMSWVTQIVAADRLAGTTQLVSEIPGCSGCPGRGTSTDPALSDDGSRVAFTGLALHVAPASEADRGQIFSFERNAVSHPQRLVSASTAAPSQEANEASWDSVTSADGRTIAFASLATDLVSGAADANLGTDVFLARPGAPLLLVSHAAGSPAVAANGGSGSARISGDGRFVAFVSVATDLVSGIADANGAADVFLFDRDGGETRLVSHRAASAAGTANARSTVEALSRDGRFVLLSSTATDLVAGQVDTNGLDDLFLFDRATGTVTLVSRARGTLAATANAASGSGRLSADGRYAAYLSGADDLVPGQVDTPGSFDAFLFDRLTGETALISHAAASTVTAADGETFTLQIDGAGRFVAWVGPASNAMAGQIDLNGAPDVFVYDRLSAANRLVSRTLASPLQTAAGYSGDPAISADGRSILFTSLAADLVAGDRNGASDVFLDRAPTTPGAFFTVPPCRVADSRLAGAPLASGGSRVEALHAACGIPLTAVAVSVNLTVVAGSAVGFVTLFPGDQPVPESSTLNFRAGQIRANNAVARLAGDGSGRLGLAASFSGSGTVHAILDVNGYFE